VFNLYKGFYFSRTFKTLDSNNWVVPTRISLHRKITIVLCDVSMLRSPDCIFRQEKKKYVGVVGIIAPELRSWGAAWHKELDL